MNSMDILFNKGQWKTICGCLWYTTKCSWSIKSFFMDHDRINLTHVGHRIPGG